MRSEADRAFDRRDFASALEKYEKAYPSYAGDLSMNERLGWILMYGPQPNFSRAAFYLRAAHRIDPRNIDVLHALAKVLSWTRSFDQAIPLYYDLLERAPAVAGYWLEFARVLVWAEEYDKAVKHFQIYMNRVPSDFKARLEFGRLLALNKDFTSAMEQYNYVLRFQPDNLDARLGLARVMAWSGQLQPALVAVDRILKDNPEHFDARLLRAFVLLWLGRIQEAKPQFVALAKEDPKNRDVKEGLRALAKLQPRRPLEPEPPAARPATELAALQRAEENESLGRFPEAISFYREHLENFPDDEGARFRLARVLGWNKEYEESAAILRDWVRKHPDNPAGFLQLARVLQWAAKEEEVVELYRKALAVDPSQVDIHLEFARFLTRKKSYTEALEEYQQAVSLQPANTEARLGIVQVLLWSGQLEEARGSLAEFRRTHPDHPQVGTLEKTLESLEAQRQAARAISAPASEEYFRALIDKDPANVAAYMELVKLLLKREAYPEAIQSLRAAAALKPEDDAILVQLARVLSWNREYAESVRIYRRLLEKGPDAQDLRLELARVLSWAKNYEDSATEYGKILEKDPDRAPVRLELARVLTWGKRYERALGEYDVLLGHDSESVEALIGKGRIYAYQRRWKQSLSAYESALLVQPGHAEARTGKAQTLLWSGQHRRARALLDELHEQNPEDTRVLISLASAENSAGRPDKALDLLEAAAVLEPQNTDVEILRDQIEARLRPELRLSWGYGRDTETLNTWRHRVDFRFNLVPQVRHFLRVDFLPASGRADVFGYPVTAAPGTGPCGAAEPAPCTFFASRVPVDPFVPVPTLLGADAFPAELLRTANDRIRQSTVQFKFGAAQQVNDWFSWKGWAGAVQLRHGSQDLQGFPSTRTRFIYSASPTFHLGQEWEVSPEFSREYLYYTPKAIAQTTRYDRQAITVVWRPDTSTRLEVRAYHHRLSPRFEIPDIDTFEGRVFRQRGYGGTLKATRVLWKGEKAEFEAGYDASAFGYTHPDGIPSPQFFVNPGVFTPSFYQRHAGLVHVNWKPTRFLTWDIHGTLGAQQILRGSDLSFSSTAGTWFDIALSSHTVLSLAYEYFNAASALQALVEPTRANAYHSNHVTVTLYFRF